MSECRSQIIYMKYTAYYMVLLKKKKNYKEYMEGIVSNIVAKSLHGEGDV